MDAGKVDTLDYAIVREFAHPGTFQWDVRITNKAVGKAVGLDEETVRQRVARLAAAGILTGWSVGVHPSLLGRRMMRIELPARTDPARAKAFEALSALGSPYLIFDFYGGRAAIVAYVEEGAAFERHLALLRTLWGEPTSVATMPQPDVAIEPTPTEWRVVAALRQDARAPFALVAERAGVSERTARRAVGRLVEGRAVWLSPIVDLTRAEGVIATSLRVHFADPSKRAPVETRLRALEGLIFFGSFPEQTQVSFAVRRLADVELLREELGRFPGVARTDADIALRRLTADAWMDEAIARLAKGP